MGKTMKDVLIPDAVFDAKHREIRKLLEPYDTYDLIRLHDPVFGTALCRSLLFEYPELLAAVGIGPLSKEDFAYNHYYRHLMLGRMWMMLHGYRGEFTDREMELLEAIDRLEEKDWNIVQEISEAGSALFDTEWYWKHGEGKEELAKALRLMEEERARAEERARRSAAAKKQS